MNTEEILYICTSCGIKENIPKEVVEYFDEIGLMSIFWTQKVKLFYAALLANNSH